MKLYFLIFATLICIVACENKNEKNANAAVAEKDTSNFTTIKWIDSVKNIGIVEAGKKAEIKFKFKNTGTKPLFIISAVPGCGCTVADYPKEAIAPGEEGMITADYHAGTQGDFRKNIHVTTNTKGSANHTIYFYGSIKNDGDSTASKRRDTGTIHAVKTRELNRNLLLKPIKN